MPVEETQNQLSGDATERVTIRLSVKDVQVLNQLAEIIGSTKEHLARKFILESAEDMADTIIAKEEIESIRTGKSKLRTWEEAGLDF